MKAQDITFFINEWGKGIVSIGKFNESPVKQKEVTEKFVHKFYGYDDSEVLFKPTRAHKIQFRQTFDGAVSYFIGNNPDFPEDHGFAKEPWNAVRFEFENVKVINGVGIAMGNYFFKNKENVEVKAEFSFVVEETKDKELKIVLHHSSLPYGQ